MSANNRSEPVLGRAEPTANLTEKPFEVRPTRVVGDFPQRAGVPSQNLSFHKQP